MPGKRALASLIVATKHDRCYSQRAIVAVDRLRLLGYLGLQNPSSATNEVLASLQQSHTREIDDPSQHVRQSRGGAQEDSSSQNLGRGTLMQIVPQILSCFKISRITLLAEKNVMSYAIPHPPRQAFRICSFVPSVYQADLRHCEQGI